jgi:hypothetical protein
MLPILLGALAHFMRESKSAGPLFWLWEFSTLACLLWGRYVSRIDRLTAWGCVAIVMLQFALFLYLFMVIDSRAKTRSTAVTDPPIANCQACGTYQPITFRYIKTGQFNDEG